jgi:deoxyribonuclease IV
VGAVQSAMACGADVAQIWGSNPRAWAPPRVSTERAEEFRAAWRESGLGPVFLHAPYMVNVASPNEEFRRRSVDLARATMDLGERVGAHGVVVHAGAGGAQTDRREAVERAARSLVAIADEADRTRLVAELTAGGTGTVASTFAQARELLDAAGRHAALRLCADTCHLFAAGYALDTEEGVGSCFDELRRHRLAGRLALVHANDSAFPRGTRRDSHTHVGEGHIGELGFAFILADPLIRRVPIVCETPGRLEDHARNIAALRRLADVAGLRRGTSARRRVRGPPGRTG